MASINIQLPAGAAPFVIRAIEMYAEDLIKRIKTGLEPQNWTPEQPYKQKFDLEDILFETEAPYGRKADGTPKKRPGRPRKGAKK